MTLYGAHDFSGGQVELSKDVVVAVAPECLVMRRGASAWGKARVPWSVVEKVMSPTREGAYRKLAAILVVEAERWKESKVALAKVEAMVKS